MSPEEIIQNSVFKRYAQREKLANEQIQTGTKVIEALEAQLIRTRKSHEDQIEKIHAIYKKPLENLRQQIKNLERDLELQDLRIRQTRIWSKATRGWILIRQDFYRRQRIRWMEELIRTKYRLRSIESHQGFIDVLFGDGVKDKLSGNQTDDSSPVTNPLPSKHYAKWLAYRRQLIESILTPKSKERIKELEKKLNYQIPVHRPTIDMGSIICPTNHVTDEHAEELSRTLNALFEQRSKIEKRLQEIRKDETDLRVVYLKKKEDCDSAYQEKLEFHCNRLDHEKKRLLEFVEIKKQIDDAKQEEIRTEFQLYKQRIKNTKLIEKETNEWFIGHKIGLVGRTGYFDCRPNTKLISNYSILTK